MPPYSNLSQSSRWFSGCFFRVSPVCDISILLLIMLCRPWFGDRGVACMLITKQRIESICHNKVSLLSIGQSASSANDGGTTHAWRDSRVRPFTNGILQQVWEVNIDSSLIFALDRITGLAWWHQKGVMVHDTNVAFWHVPEYKRTYVDQMCFYSNG
mgnify:CR=1 FL=1